MTTDFYDTLPADYARHCVPANADLANWEALAPLFETLETRDISSAEALLAWLSDRDELSAAADGAAAALSAGRPSVSAAVSCSAWAEACSDGSGEASTASAVGSPDAFADTST